MSGKKAAAICTGMILTAGILTACSRNTTPETIVPKETEVQTSVMQKETEEQMTEQTVTEAGTENSTEISTEMVSTEMTSTEAAETVVLEAYIQEIDGKILILADKDGGLYQMDTEGVDIQEELQPGMAVDIVYSGILMRNIPATLPQVESVTVVNDREDPYGFYRTVLQTIWDTKPELNEGIELVALDLSDAENINEDQKYVLEYVMRGIAQCDVRLASDDQLEREGILDDERDQFSGVKGMLISIDDEKRRENQILFDAEKWISDRAEAEWDDQTARYENGTWVF